MLLKPEERQANCLSMHLEKRVKDCEKNVQTESFKLRHCLLNQISLTNSREQTVTDSTLAMICVKQPAAVDEH